MHPLPNLPETDSLYGETEDHRSTAGRERGTAGPWVNRDAELIYVYTSIRSIDFERNGIIMGFFLKHPRLWGGVFITIAVIGSNFGSAWAGGEYRLLSTQPPWQNSAPASVGFQVLMYTVYPLAIALLALGVYLWSRHKRP